ncbi:hypothetical protein JCM14469_29410 [Desulfatiferula olefinivorans]
MTHSIPDLKELLVLYNDNRFIDAYHRYAWIWDDPRTSAETFSCECCVHLGRLSGRLGSTEIQEVFYKRAMDLDPEHSLVRYYAGRKSDDMTVIDDIRAFEDAPDLCFPDPEFQAAWYAGTACLYAFVRDFDAAHRLLDKARALQCNDDWVACCAADVLFRQDLWDDALSEAMRAFELSPHMPAVASILGRILVKKDETSRITDLFAPWIDSCQSYEFMLTAIWYLCATAERAGEDERRELARKAHGLAAGLDRLAPLADESTREKIRACRMDIAMLQGDYDALMREGEGTTSPFYDQVIENIRANRNGGRLVTPFRAVFQKHLTCLPSSAASVLGTFDIAIDDDDLARELTYNGTAMWRIEDWFRAGDFETRACVLTPGLMVSMLKAGLPFIAITEYVSSSHAVAVVGLDERTGTFLIHDPSSERLVHVLINRFDEGEKPIGPMGLAIVPRERAALLDHIPARAHEPARAYHDYSRYMEQNVPGKALERIREYVDAWPGQPFSLRFEALEKADAGFVYQAIDIQKKLLNDYPECLIIQKDLLNNLHRTRNKSFVRAMLRNIVTRGKMPGSSKQKEWAYPPTSWVAQYADFIGDNAEGFPEAEHCLISAIARDPWSSEAYHILGDIYIRQGKYAEAEIPCRVAALMDEHNDHYAREACNVLRRLGRETEALDGLVRRMDRLAGKIHGGQAIITTVEAFLDYGYPDRAMALMTQAGSRWETDPHLASYAVQFWVRMGHWDWAAKALSAIVKTGRRILYLSAAVNYYRKSGQWETALDLARDWMAECPHDIEARRHVLAGHKRKEGYLSALALSEQWKNEFKNDEAFESVYYDELKGLHKRSEQEAYIRRRIRRNPYDIWAWHELGFLILSRVDLVSGGQRAAMLEEMDGVLERIQSIASDHPVSHALMADTLSSRMDFDRAVDHFLKAIEDDPAYTYCYSRIWEVSQSFAESRQLNVLDTLEHHMFRVVGFLHGARSLAFNVAERFGAEKAKACVERWSVRKPDDPVLIEAMVDLLLNYGKGRSDAGTAVAILEGALARFPNHLGLWESLAQAYHTLLMPDKEEEVLREILRRYPLIEGCRNRLARIINENGDADKAIALLREGLDFDPLSVPGWHHLADLLWDTDRYDEALGVLDAGLTLMPEDISLRRMYSQRLQEAGRHEDAVAVLKDGLVIYPDGAYLWQLYGEALLRSDSHTDTKEMEDAFCKALELNHTLYDAADNLAVLLADQSRFAEARDLMTHQMAILDDPMAAHGRLVWIKRRQGETREARAEMAAVVRKWPTYDWAWTQLIHWLDADEDYDLAKELLHTVHPVMADNPRFMADRLILLGKAGIEKAVLAPQWERLLADFPRYERLHTLRIDQLIREESFDEAERVLADIERFLPDSPYILTRRVTLDIEFNRFDDAVASACRIWTKQGGEDAWPDERVFELIREAGHMDRALSALLDLAENGQRIRPRAFLNLVENLKTLETRRRFLFALIPFRWFFSSRTVERLIRLLDMVRARDWDRGVYQAMILDALLDLGEHRLVKGYARRHWSDCMGHTPIWQTLGRMHMTDKRRDYRFVRHIMAGWRNHPGCEMWAVTNYVICLRRRGGWLPISEDLDELYRTCRDLIAFVPHDHTIRYIVSVCCEAALRKGLDEEFFALTEQFAHLLANEDKGLWMRNGTRWVPGVLLMFRRMMAESDPRALMDLTRECLSIMGNSPMKNTGNWVRTQWLKRLLPRLPWPRRLLAWVLFL